MRAAAGGRKGAIRDVPPLVPGTLRSAVHIHRSGRGAETVRRVAATNSDCSHRQFDGRDDSLDLSRIREETPMQCHLSLSELSWSLRGRLNTFLFPVPECTGARTWYELELEWSRVLARRAISHL